MKTGKYCEKQMKLFKSVLLFFTVYVILSIIKIDCFKELL